MRYMLLIYEAETVWEKMTEQEMSAIFREAGEFIASKRP